MADRNDETRARIIEVPEEIAARADEVAALADHLAGRLSTSVRGDAEASAELARAAARVARRLAELNRA
jgi:formiminotetrahydrofolate cyclodeaminase